ncbi:hypothetical protein [Amylibacter sp. IMCC11727]|uniref:hypothetical protein n=1 Tax=Amylibacter sp. IMCC11727 TaxID=3039851 RepID=UPI00244E4F46|nr:hypothetical protein [Amylibacter sp. IMCC11727]WGI22218.1 hypothetical protein QBD29_02020 [Amylibacter sp. IMCC11727]
MTTLRYICFGYTVSLLIAASLNYIPGLTDAEGLAFGIFALDIFDDSLHFFSALWALIAGLMSHRAARIFLTYFGALYLGDGLLGLITGSGYLDFGIFNYGIQDLGFMFKVFNNLPHLALGGFALFAVWMWDRK